MCDDRLACKVHKDNPYKKNKWDKNQFNNKYIAQNYQNAQKHVQD